jgi:hypothetical protein
MATLEVFEETFETVDKHQQAAEITPPSSETGSNNTTIHHHDANELQTPTGLHKEQPGISPLYPQVEFQFEERHIDEPRALRVAVIGAGLAGITAGILFPAKVPGIQLTIFDKNKDVVSLVGNT